MYKTHAHNFLIPSKLGCPHGPNWWWVDRANEVVNARNILLCYALCVPAEKKFQWFLIGRELSPTSTLGTALAIYGSMALEATWCPRFGGSPSPPKWRSESQKDPDAKWCLWGTPTPPTAPPLFPLLLQFVVQQSHKKGPQWPQPKNVFLRP